MFPNPVKGIIHPKGWTRPSGNVEFVVTRTSADHVATNQGKGLDISSRRCNVDPVLAMAAGKVVARDDTQGIIVLDHGTGYRTHYAHMRQLRYGVGASVALGAALGMVSDAHDPSITNFAGCHLHFGITRYVSGAWVAQDPWPLLDQNGAKDDVKLKGTNPRPIKNSTGTITAGGYLVADCTAQPYINLHPMPVGTAFTPDWQVTGNTILGTDQWYGTWVFTNPPQFGYLSLGLCGPLQQGGGFTQADIDAAEAAAAALVADAAVKEAGKYR